MTAMTRREAVLGLTAAAMEAKMQIAPLAPVALPANATFEDFTAAMLRQIAATMALPYDMLREDFCRSEHSALVARHLVPVVQQ